MEEVNTQTMETPSDEATLQEFIKLLEERVSITTGFIPDEDTGVLTHQVLQITCGDYTMVSKPEPLAIPLQAVGASDLDVTIN